LAPLTDRQRYLLASCVDRYLLLDAAGRAEFERFINADQEVRTMTKGFIERAYDEGVEKGRLAAMFELVEALLEKKFGPLSAEIVDRLRQKPADDVRAMAVQIVSATSLAELGLAD
jgi:hypothetical protein